MVSGQSCQVGVEKLRDTGPIRVFGAATAAYGAYVLVRPGSLARPLGRRSPGEPVGFGFGLIERIVGLRDVASGVAILAAAPGAPLVTALQVRMTADAVDSVVFSALATSTSTRAMAAGAAGGWFVLGALSLVRARRG